MILIFKTQDEPARNAGCGSQNSRGTSRSCGRRRSAAFTPLQRGQPFGVRCLLAVRESKRHKCRAPCASRRLLNCMVTAEARAPISSFGRHGMGRWRREFSWAGQNCTGVKWRSGAEMVQKRCGFPGPSVGRGESRILDLISRWRFPEGNKENEGVRSGGAAVERFRRGQSPFLPASFPSFSAVSRLRFPSLIAA